MKILMVCLGNICRSPVAEGVMRAKAKEHVLEVEIDSAGTSGWHDGAAPDERSLTNASKNGIDISKQKSRKVVLSDFEVFDFLYAMDESNYNNLLNMASQKYHHKIKMILNEVNAGDNRSVPDPYYGNDGFQLVFDLLDEACEKIAQNLKR
ncbi:MAG: low molecular weight protein-tyrosine-phosphatase [Akkermansiaceae bacterium]|jgi:protein-tyrosine phosphatase|tara:strand:+ start:62 stop:514 length:453 start_codon:yes stop_codon:yes gene_type:complete